MTVQEIIDNVQKDTDTKSESRINPLVWQRFVTDAVTAAFQIDPCLRIQAAGVISDAVFSIADGVDPTSADIPTTLIPYHNGLEAYVEWRYHSSSPTNDAESAASTACYNRFLNAFGATQKA